MIYAFEDCELDTDRYELRRDGEPVALEPQVLDVLIHLVTHRDRLVTKMELLDEVWGNRFVSESALASRVRDARRAIGDDGRAQRMIRTVHGRGFRFVAEASAVEAPRAVTVARGALPTQEVRYCRAADGVRLAYATSGAGRPLVKAANWLTHLRADWESIVWGHWLRDLAGRFRLVHYDARASGMSDWDVGDVGFDAWVNDLETVVDAVGLDQFALMGVSQGGAVAVAYAARHPERVSHLVLYGSFAEGRFVRARSEREIRQAKTMLDVIEAAWADEPSIFRHMFASQFMPEASTEQWEAFDAHQRLTASPENARRLLTVSASIDVRDVAPEVQTPTLVIHARDDRRVPFAEGELLAALIPGARLLALDSPNHLLLDGERAWSEFLTAVDSFVT